MKIWLLYLTIVPILLSCSEKNAEKTEIAIIDPKISRNQIYKKLDKFSDHPFGNNEQLLKRSSNVNYDRFWYGYKTPIEFAKYNRYNNCRARIINDTLAIAIGTTTGFSDSGISIIYKNGKYTALPFEFWDIRLPSDTAKRYYKLIKRELVLDKENYKIGDSLYGRINLSLVEPDTMKKKIFKGFKGFKHNAYGSFRTKITTVY